METCDENEELISSKTQIKVITNRSLKSDVILCKHCRRSASNGIRCLGMCVADNDY